MGKLTLAETIRRISAEHLAKNGGLILGQCISAVGWVNGTVPSGVKGVIELPMIDVAGAGIAVGAAIVGRRPIFIVRFQDFMVLNGSPLINYAAKCKELHGRSAPVFIRALASDGLGPVHSGVLHGVFMHFPGFKVCAPMTPGEYMTIWKEFMAGDDPMFVSEDRASFKNTEELKDVVRPRAAITLFGIASTRFQLEEAARLLEGEGVTCNLVHIFRLKPFKIDARVLAPLKRSGLGLVIDSGFEISGAARSIAYELGAASGCTVRALGLADKTKCLCPPYQNKTPDAHKIFIAAKEAIKTR
ncbi:MAG: hypothetical protein A2X39_04965 [Elusimicrobia bacterium GWC2_56_31]|nr:MAG: hypothetical protein A2X39_04965 [Elusimicrobia bacterium GWC2_56_31]HBB67683.1 hypothetical protein [Elusimicrobiota bacterium]HBW22865.1 hypothetical protein [Elusimicrobiota bacterium]